MALSKSIEEYLAAGGWSSNLFLEHAKVLFNDRDLKRGCKFEVGRSVIYIRSGGQVLKVYVHHNGRTKEYMTLSEGGTEVATFHYTAKTEEIKQTILKFFRGEL